MSIRRCNIKEQLSDIWKLAFEITLVLIAAAIGYFMGDPGAVQGMVIGAAVGVFLHWRATEKASISISSSLVPYAKAWAERKGYTLCKNRDILIPDAHRLLRFDSQNMKFVRIDEVNTTMFGPYYMLKMFAKTI